MGGQHFAHGTPSAHDSQYPDSPYDLEPSDEQRTARQPISFMVVAGVCVLASVALLYWRWDSKPANVAAWVLAGPVAVTFLGLFLGADTRRRAATVYYTKVWSGPAYRIAAVAAISASAAASWAIAQWLVRL